MLLGEPCHGRAPAYRAMAADLVPVLDIGRQRAPQRLEFPDRLLTIELRHIVPKRAFKLAIGLRVLWRGMDEPDPEVPTEGLQQCAAKHAALVKDDALGNHLPLPHGAPQGGNSGPRIDMVKKITEHIAARIIISKGHLIQLPPGRL